MSAEVAYNSMDLLQAAHTWSGVETALWDLLGKARGEPVWKMLVYARSHPKTPYASVLFGDTPAETLARARDIRTKSFRAAKFGWGPIGRGTAARDAAHFSAAREGLGADAILLVDTGQIFIDDVARAAERLPALEQAGATWFEEPFAASALAAYGALARQSRSVKLAGGEGAHNVDMAKHLIDFGGVGYIQIDCGRIGGIGPSKQVADYAVAKGVTFVNHTFTSHLALSASMQPYAGLADHRICEFPAMPKPLALELSENHLAPDRNGEIAAPDAPGLGIAVSPAGVRKYLQQVDIRVNGRTLFSTPKI
jgi:L-alanine-DL-glutamate epimerase-like enolase superfamily enzyme